MTDWPKVAAWTIATLFCAVCRAAFLGWVLS